MSKDLYEVYKAVSQEGEVLYVGYGKRGRHTHCMSGISHNKELNRYYFMNSGKMFVEVIHENLDYNILLGRPWIYAMAAVVSTYFRKIAFPFQGIITIVDQQTFLPNSSQVTGSIPMIHARDHFFQNIGVGFLKDPALMGTFALPPPSNLAEVATVETYKMKSNPIFWLDSEDS